MSISSMQYKILDGKAVAAHMRDEIKKNITAMIESSDEHLEKSSTLKKIGPPGLAVILVGSDSASTVYVKNKLHACLEVRMEPIRHNLPENTTQKKLSELIDQLNKCSDVHGILVQLPLPAHINANDIIEKILPEKDVDGFHPINLGRLAQNRSVLRPCTPYGVMLLLEHYQINVQKMNAVVVGASNIVGRPMALELLNAGSTVTICHHLTQDLAAHIKQADLLVAAIGNPNVIKSEWIKKDAIVIDIGFNHLPDGSIVGDIDFNSAVKRASRITPVPGGVGPMTVATLLQNTYQAYLQQIK